MQSADGTTDDLSSGLDSNLGISRRTLVRRGAVLGGAMIWAAPTIRALATPAFAAGSPPPPDDDGGPAVSYIAAVARCDDGVWYRAKWEFDGRFWEADPGPSFPDADLSDCYPTPEYTKNNSTPVDGGAEGMSVSPGADESQATLFVPATLAVQGCKVLEVKATAKGGSSACQEKATGTPLPTGGFSLRFDL